MLFGISIVITRENCFVFECDELRLVSIAIFLSKGNVQDDYFNRKPYKELREIFPGSHFYNIHIYIYNKLF